MYLTSIDALTRTLNKRAINRKEIRERHTAFLESQYGVASMPSILPSLLKQEAEQAPMAFLARQIASMCMEDLAFEAGATALGLRPVTITFVRDAFSVRNHDKMRRIEVPWIEWTPKGVKRLAYERVTGVPSEELDATPLEAIECSNGKKLPQFHQNLRKSARMRGVVYDISHIHSYMLMHAKKLPSFVYRTQGKKEVRHELSLHERPLPGDRPPASWYYPYYLSWFVDGTCVLFETYDNPMGEVSHAKKIFEDCMRNVTASIGYVPLIVKIPPLSEKMLHCSRHFLWRNDALPTLHLQAERTDTSDSVSFFETIANAAADFR